MQLRNMRRKLKQKRRNFEIIKILKRRNFEAVAERGGANRGISVHIYINIALHICISKPGITISYHNCAERIHTLCLCPFIQSSSRLRHAHISVDVIIFFMFTLRKYFMLKNNFLKYKVLYVLKTHFNYFNNQVNIFDAMERLF